MIPKNINITYNIESVEARKGVEEMIPKNINITYNIESVEDEKNFKAVMMAEDFLMCLYDIDRELTRECKHGKHEALFYRLRQKFYEILSDRDVDLDSLIY